MRVVVGLLGAIGAVRFLVNGWVEQFFGRTSFAFHYVATGPLPEPPVPVLQAIFAALAVLSLMVAAGWHYRVAAGLHVIGFTYVELLDVTYYLNHYYLLSLLGLLLVVLPLHRARSIDVRRRPELRWDTFPAWMLWLLRFQVGVVYVFAGLAKAQPDWLVHAQPLNIWLASRTEFPIIGGLFAHWETALAFSWGGFLFDTTIVGFLLWRRTTWLAYAVVVGFHLMTGMLFHIGMFPFIMMAAATVFLPSPPVVASEQRHAPPPRALVVALAVWLAVQVALPLRAVVYPGHWFTSDVLWHEQGMRWSWRVMVREKAGDVIYRVRTPDARTYHVPPSRYLTPYQEREMSGQPDLILQLAHHIGAECAASEGASCEVRVDAMASLNGRRAHPLIEPNVDLMSVSDSLRPAAWILPLPDEAPPRLRPVR